MATVKATAFCRVLWCLSWKRVEHGSFVLVWGFIVARKARERDCNIEHVISPLYFFFIDLLKVFNLRRNSDR